MRLAVCLLVQYCSWSEIELKFRVVSLTYLKIALCFIFGFVLFFLHSHLLTCSIACWTSGVRCKIASNSSTNSISSSSIIEIKTRFLGHWTTSSNKGVVGMGRTELIRPTPEDDGIVADCMNCAFTCEGVCICVKTASC